MSEQIRPDELKAFFSKDAVIFIPAIPIAKTFNNVSIVVIDRIFNSLTVAFVKIKKTAVPIIGIPYSNFKISILNEIVDPSRRLFLSLISVNVLKDTVGFSGKIQNEILSLYKEINFYEQFRFRKVKHQLEKTMSGLTQELYYHQRFVILNDITTTILNYERSVLLNATTNIISDADLLYEKKQSILDKLIHLSHASLANQGKSKFSNVSRFVREYIDVKEARFEQELGDLLIFDVTYEGCSIESFVDKDLVEIKESRSLKPLFQCFYLSSKQHKRLYSNDISIVISKNQETSSNDLVVLLKTVFSERQNVKISLKPSHVIRSQSSVLPFHFLLPLKKKANDLVSDLIKTDGFYDSERCILILLILISFVYHQTGIGYSDFLKISEYFCEKCCDVLDDTRTILSSVKYEYNKAQVLTMFNHYYGTNKTLLYEAIKKGQNLTGVESDKSYSTLSNELYSLVVNNPSTCCNVPQNNNLLLEILSEIYHIKDPEKALYFISITEALAESLLIEENRIPLPTFLLVKYIGQHLEQ